VRIRKLPKGTQEGLLQQTLEKYAVVKRVEVFSNLNEATVELENAAVSALFVGVVRRLIQDRKLENYCY
jgi:hypothetical protein